ncbi:hypothetical protein I2W78_27345 [Streptomyces spinoverrucosus]|uniref:hypothetical protein n=1 Tax=Streptomyces spinoverrucosus TaxID=284043 RepID=UPI0018C38E48|nr:hypothetical protein [Streptomyces spinoverrucosus]MBG0855455.1 hypothetical protein [Streptomyces spinoverrucosus]
MSDDTLLDRARHIAEEARQILEELRAKDDPEHLDTAAPAVAAPFEEAFADLAEVCELLAAAAPHSIHHGPLRESAATLRALTRHWYAVRLNAGCTGVV